MISGLRKPRLFASIYGQVSQVVDPVVRRQARQCFHLTVAVANRARLDPGAPPGFHVGGGIAHHEAVFRLRVERFERGQDDVRRRLAGETIGALHVVEILDQSKLFEYQSRGGCAFGGGGALASAQRGQPLQRARIGFRQLVAPAAVAGAILLNQSVDLRGIVARKDFLEQVDKVKADVALQVFEVLRAGAVRVEHLLDRPADIQRGIEQGAVDVEQINRKSRDHAGCGRSPSERPGSRRGPSGRSTCWVPSASAALPPPEDSRGGSVLPLMICVTSAPSRISRSSSASAILTSASECLSMMAAAVS